MRIFTIQTLEVTGLGDQLGTQFSRMYALGRALGLEYVYSPLRFPRSVEPFWVLFINRLIFKARLMLLMWGATKSNLLIRCLRGIETRIIRINARANDSTLISFLGLEGSPVRGDAVFHDVTIDRIFTHDCISLHDLAQAIGGLDEAEGKIIRFIWDFHSYKRIAQIDALLRHVKLEPESVSYPFLRKKYWMKRSAEKRRLSESVDLLVHIRSGDNTVVDLGTRSFVINGESIMTDEAFNEVLKVDPNRAPIRVAEYLDVCRDLVLDPEARKFRVTVISDGFERTYQTFMRSIFRPESEIQLTRSERAAFKQMVLAGNLMFRQFGDIFDAELIIGETKNNMLKSIDALADSKRVIYGSGGFSYYIHSLYRKNIDSKVVHIRRDRAGIVQELTAPVSSRQAP